MRKILSNKKGNKVSLLDAANDLLASDDGINLDSPKREGFDAKLADMLMNNRADSGELKDCADINSSNYYNKSKS